MLHKDDSFELQEEQKTKKRKREEDDLALTERVVKKNKESNKERIEYKNRYIYYDKRKEGKLTQEEVKERLVSKDATIDTDANGQLHENGRRVIKINAYYYHISSLISSCEYVFKNTGQPVSPELLTHEVKQHKCIDDQIIITLAAFRRRDFQFVDGSQRLLSAEEKQNITYCDETKKLYLGQREVIWLSRKVVNQRNENSTNRAHSMPISEKLKSQNKSTHNEISETRYIYYDKFTEAKLSLEEIKDRLIPDIDVTKITGSSKTGNSQIFLNQKPIMTLKAYNEYMRVQYVFKKTGEPIPLEKIPPEVRRSKFKSMDHKKIMTFRSFIKQDFKFVDGDQLSLDEKKRIKYNVEDGKLYVDERRVILIINKKKLSHTELEVDEQKQGINATGLIEEINFSNPNHQLTAFQPRKKSHKEVNLKLAKNSNVVTQVINNPMVDSSYPTTTGFYQQAYQNTWNQTIFASAAQQPFTKPKFIANLSVDPLLADFNIREVSDISRMTNDEAQSLLRRMIEIGRVNENRTIAFNELKLLKKEIVNGLFDECMKNIFKQGDFSDPYRLDVGKLFSVENNLLKKLINIFGDEFVKERAGIAIEKMAEINDVIFDKATYIPFYTWLMPRDYSNLSTINTASDYYQPQSVSYLPYTLPDQQFRMELSSDYATNYSQEYLLSMQQQEQKQNQKDSIMSDQSMYHYEQHNVYFSEEVMTMTKNVPAYYYPQRVAPSYNYNAGLWQKDTTSTVQQQRPYADNNGMLRNTSQFKLQ